MNYNNKFTSDVAADLHQYNMTDVYDTALNKSILQNFLYFIILLIYLHYGTYNTPGHYLFLIISTCFAVKGCPFSVKYFTTSSG